MSVNTAKLATGRMITSSSTSRPLDYVNILVILARAEAPRCTIIWASSGFSPSRQAATGASGVRLIRGGPRLPLSLKRSLNADITEVIHTARRSRVCQGALESRPSSPKLCLALLRFNPQQWIIFSSPVMSPIPRLAGPPMQSDISSRLQS